MNYLGFCVSSQVAKSPHLLRASGKGLPANKCHPAAASMSIKENRVPSAQYPRRMPHSLACLLAHLRGSRPGLLQFTAAWRHALQVCFNLLQSVQLAVWSSGMILAQGARGPGPSSQNSPSQAWHPSWPGKRLSSHLDPGITRAPRHAHDHCVIDMRLDKRSQGGSNSRP